MDILEGNPILQGVRQMLGAFAKSAVRPVAAKHDAEESMPWELMKQAQMLGMSQTSLVETPDAMKAMDGGGAGKDGKPRPSLKSQVACVGAEELAWGCAGITLALGGSGLAAAPVARMGTPEQKKLFTDCLKGTDDKGRVKVAAMALSEPSTGSDISSLATTARKDGDHYIITGMKQWITNGQSASVYVVWAQTDPALGRAGVRGFVVPRGTPGLVPGRKEVKLGIRASETAQVHFEECRVPREWLLGGDEGAKEGLAGTKKMLDATRPIVAVQAVGIARAAFEYLLERVQGGTYAGTPLAGHQHIGFALAEMEMEIQASRLLAWRSAWMADQKMENVKWASIAKAHGARTAMDVTTRVLQLLGEEAMQPGHPVEKWYRDAKIYDIFEGTGQIQRRIIAKELTGVNPV